MPLLWSLFGLLAGSVLDLFVRQLTHSHEELCSSGCTCSGPRVSAGVIPIFGPMITSSCPVCGTLAKGRLIIQIAMAVVFGALALRVTDPLPLAIFSLYAVILLAAFVTDLRHRLILNAVTYPGMLIALAGTSLLLGPDLLNGLRLTILGGLFAGGLFLGLYLTALLIYRRDDAFGMGDVKLAFLIGLMLGWPASMAAILLGTVLGAILGVGVLLRSRSAKATMPYGVALSLGALVTMLWRPPV